MKNSLFIKVVLTLSIIGASLVPAHSQALIALLFGKKISNDKLQLGLFLAAQNPVMYPMKGDFLNVGFSIGAYTDIKLGTSDKWMLSNYLVFKSPQGVRHLPATENFLDINDLPIELQGLEGIYINRDITNFEITPLIRYNITPSWAIGTGPCFGFRMIAKDTYVSTRTDSEGNKIGVWDYTTSIKSYTNWYNVGFAIDVQYRLLKGKGMNFNVRYAQGFTDVYKNTSQSGRSAYIHVGMGIPIGGRNKVEETPTVNLIKSDNHNE